MITCIKPEKATKEEGLKESQENDGECIIGGQVEGAPDNKVRQLLHLHLRYNRPRCGTGYYNLALKKRLQMTSQREAVQLVKRRDSNSHEN